MKYQVVTVLKYTFFILGLGTMIFAQDFSTAPHLDHSVRWVEGTWDEALSRDRLLGPVPPQTTDYRRPLQDLARNPLLNSKAFAGFRVAASEAGNVSRTATQLGNLPLHALGFLAQSDDNSSVSAAPSGAVSPEFVVSASNQAIRIQTRDGGEVSTVTPARFFSNIGPFSGAFLTPQVAFEPVSRRWIIVYSADPLLNSAAIVIAFSQTADPRGAWRFSRLNATLPDAAYGNLKIGTTAKMLVISADQFELIFYDSTRNFVFSMAELIAGGAVPNVFEDFLEANAPASDPGPDGTRMMLVNNSYNLNNGNYLLALKEIRLAGPTASSLVVGTRYAVDAGDIAAYAPTNLLPQGGNAAKINPYTSGINNCVTRGPGVWCVNTMFVRFGQELRSVVQYTRLNWGVTGNATLAERVRIDDPAGVNFYAYPSIAVNRNNDVLIGYNRFRADDPVAAMYAYRRSTDPPSSLSFDNLAKAGEDYYIKGGLSIILWGPFSSTVTDPADDTAFWTLSKYPSPARSPATVCGGFGGRAWRHAAAHARIAWMGQTPPIFLLAAATCAPTSFPRPPTAPTSLRRTPLGFPTPAPYPPQATPASISPSRPTAPASRAPQPSASAAKP
jgi:hypothetical protein